MKRWVALFSLLCVFAAPVAVFAAEAVFETASVTGRHAYQKSFYGSMGSSCDIYVQSDQPVSVHIFRRVHKSPRNGGSMWRDHKVAGSDLQTSHLLTVAVPVEDKRKEDSSLHYLVSVTAEENVTAYFTVKIVEKK